MITNDVRPIHEINTRLSLQKHHSTRKYSSYR